MEQTTKNLVFKGYTPYLICISRVFQYRLIIVHLSSEHLNLVFNQVGNKTSFSSFCLYYKMAQIYCGNNGQDQQLLAGNVVLGTRYDCMRKGIGHGLYLPYDPKFAGAYIPIDQRQIYCGIQQVLPAGYDSMGSIVQCMQKGVGIGKRQKALQGPPRFMLFKYVILPILIFLILATGLFSYLYFTKPSIVTTKDSENREYLDWGKFSAFYVPIMVLLCVIIFLFWKFWITKSY